MDQVTGVGDGEEGVGACRRRTVFSGRRKRGMGLGGRTHFVACLNRLAIDHASLSRRSTVPTL